MSTRDGVRASIFRTPLLHLGGSFGSGNRTPVATFCALAPATGPQLCLALAWQPPQSTARIVCAACPATAPARAPEWRMFAVSACKACSVGGVCGARTCAKMTASSPKTINIKMSAMATLYFFLGSTSSSSSTSPSASALPVCFRRRRWSGGSGPVCGGTSHAT